MRFIFFFLGLGFCYLWKGGIDGVLFCLLLLGVFVGWGDGGACCVDFVF